MTPIPPADPTGPPDGRIVAGGAVIWVGDGLARIARSLDIARRTRKLNGLPDRPADQADRAAIAQAMAASGQTDGRKTTVPQHYPQLQPTVALPVAARLLGLSERHMRRKAKELGGRKIGGRWLLDQDAINEHMKGRDIPWTATA